MIGGNESAFKKCYLLFFIGIVVFWWCSGRLLDSKKGHFNGFRVETVTPTESHKLELEQLGLTVKDQVKFCSAQGGETLIHGRFLHITDFHPDPYYKVGSKHDEACHSGKGNSGKYGDAILGCDSPLILVHDTIKWVEEKLGDKLDFIVWTGDNVRHDNDRKYPRTEQSIFDQNEALSELMFSTFKSKDPNDPKKLRVPLIPSLGNNDVYPHNLFAPGPTLQTRELFRIWKDYVPPSQLHVFNRGVYFFEEVIPGQLAVLSINTLYLFESNPLVDHCDSAKQPGYKLFEWLGYVLKEMRARKMKVWLTGHVPPNEKNFHNSCLRKYIVWTHEYRDVIIGGLFGHMNLDHFIALDSMAAYKSIEKDFELSELTDDWNESPDGTKPFISNALHKDVFAKGGIPYNKVRYMESLRENMYAKVKGKKKSGDASQRYSIVHVGASIVPTFNPGFTVWEYNITGLDSLLGSRNQPWDDFFKGMSKLMQDFERYDNEDNDENIPIENIDAEDPILEIEEVQSEMKNKKKRGKKKKKKKNKKKKDKTLPPKMPADLPLGPAFIPQTFTPTRYVSYYADLESINKGKKKFGYEVEYATDDDLYNMENLTTDEWIKFARILGKPVKKKMSMETSEDDETELENTWKYYLKNSFVSSGYESKNFG